MVAARDVWARTCSRVVGGARLAIARRDASVVVIIRTCEALQVRERVSPSVDTNGRRGEPAVVRRGWSSIVCWGPTRMLECIVGRSCWAWLRAKERAGPKGAVTPPWSGGRTVGILHVPVDDRPERCEVDRFVVFAHGRAYIIGRNYYYLLLFCSAFLVWTNSYVNCTTWPFLDRTRESDACFFFPQVHDGRRDL